MVVLESISRISLVLVANGNPGAESSQSDRLTDRIGLGVLTRLVHRDLVDEVLAQTHRTERRRRLLPARVVVYFVLAMTLFFDDAYEEVMRKLVEGLRFLRSWDDDWQVPSSSALCQARARLGAEPLRVLYDRIARPLAGAGTPGAWLGDLRVMAIDGVQLDIPDTADNDQEFGRGARLGDLEPPYPKVKVVGLAECGTHAVIDAHIGGARTGERDLARPLLVNLEPGMLLLADRGFYGREFWEEAADTGAQLLWRVQVPMQLPVITELADGRLLSERADEPIGIPTPPPLDVTRGEHHPAGRSSASHRIRHRQQRDSERIADPTHHHHLRPTDRLGHRARRGLPPTLGV
jgi:hypothetical protein